MSPRSVSLRSLSAADPEARVDPYPRLAALRACPIARDEAAGAAVIARHAEARLALAHPGCRKNPDLAEPAALAIRRRRATSPAGLHYPDDQKASILEMDGEEHARVRGPLVAALKARIGRFQADCDRIVAAALDEAAADAAANDGVFDLIAAVAEPVPVATIGALLGVAPRDLPRFRRWLAGIVQTFNPERTAAEDAALVDASNGLAGYMRARYAAARDAPGDDLFGDLARAQAAGAPISDVEISFNLRGLLIAGNVTTTDLIGNAAWLLLTHPDQRARLAAEPELWPAAVEEALRFEAPVDFTWRIAPEGFEPGPAPLRPDEALYVSLRAANRCEREFVEPDRFDLGRRPNRHLAFGGGAHVCPGAPLARMEARAALRGLFERFPRLTLADPDAPPAWRALPGFRGLGALWLRTG